MNNLQNKKITSEISLLDETTWSNNKTVELTDEITKYKKISIKVKGHYSSSTDYFNSFITLLSSEIVFNENISCVEIYGATDKNARGIIVFTDSKHVKMSSFYSGYGLVSLSIKGTM